MIEIDVLALRRSVCLVHFLQKERALTCSLLLTKHGDIGKDALEISKANHQDVDTIFQGFHFSRRMTDAAMTGLQGFQTDETLQKFNYILSKARMVLEDDHAIEQLKSESSELGFLSVLMSHTFQTSLTKYNELIIRLIQSGVFEFGPIPGSKGAFSEPNPSFDVEKITTKILPHSSKLKTPMSALLKGCFSTLEILHDYSLELAKLKASHIKTCSSLSGIEIRITALYSLLVALINLEESFILETIFLQELFSCKESKNKDAVYKFRIKHMSKQYPQVPVLVKMLIIHFEYQQKAIAAVEMAANDIDCHTFAKGHSFVSELVQDNLRLDNKIKELKHFVRHDDHQMKGIQKIITNSGFIKSSIVQYDKLHGIELSIIEEIEYCQVLSEEVDPSLTQRHLMKDDHRKPTHTEMAYAASAHSAFNNMSSSETRKMVEEMTPELMQSTLFSLLKVETEHSHSARSMTEVKDGEDEEDASLPLHLVPVVNEWQVNLDELNFKKRIGNGGAGTTYLSKWRRQDVAVKVAAANSLGMTGWKKELQFLKNLHHPNVIRMLGCVYSETPFAMSLILEFCDQGDLGRVLNKATSKDFFLTASLGLANGLSYLHHKGIVHRDIKPDNILVHGNIETGDFSVKIIDFGLSAYFDIKKYQLLATRRLSAGIASTGAFDSTHSLGSTRSVSSTRSIVSDTIDDEEEYTAEIGTYRWMAPEIIRNDFYNFKCDMYSFAIVLWQLITREQPYAGIEQNRAAKLVAEQFKRPPFPKGTPKLIISLIEECWNEEPEERPLFNNICDSLETLREKLSKDDSKWLNRSNGNQIYSKMKTTEFDPVSGEVKKKHVRRGSGLFRMSMYSAKKPQTASSSSFFL